MTKFDSSEYRHESNAVSLLNYHFVWIPKRRKPVLVGDVARRLEEIIYEVSNENRWRIIAMEIMSDHVHLFLNVKPSDDPASIIRLHQRQSVSSLKKRVSPIA